MRMEYFLRLASVTLISLLLVTPATAFDIGDVLRAFDQDTGRPSPKQAMEWAKITVKEISGFTVSDDVKLNLVEKGEFRKLYLNEINDDPASQTFLKDSAERQFVLKTLGVIDKDVNIPDKYRSGNLDMMSGFYSPLSKDMTIIKRMEGQLMQQTLLHELTHAGQDAQKDLTGLHKEHGKTFDSSMAFTAFIEGQAQLVTTLAYVMKSRQYKNSPKEVMSKWSSELERWWENEDLPLDN